MKKNYIAPDILKINLLSGDIMNGSGEDVSDIGGGDLGVNAGLIF